MVLGGVADERLGSRRVPDRSQAFAAVSCSPASSSPPSDSALSSFILAVSDEERWLDLSFPAEAAVSLLRPYPAAAMRAVTVSSRVSSVLNDDPDLLVPVTHAA